MSVTLVKALTVTGRVRGMSTDEMTGQRIELRGHEVREVAGPSASAAYFDGVRMAHRLCPDAIEAVTPLERL